MATGSTQTNTVGATNPALNTLFISLFGSGGAGSTGVSSLSNIASGTNLTALNTALTAGAKQQTTQGAAQIKEAFGSSGMGSSSTLAKALGSYYTQQNNALTSNLASADLTAQGQQLSAASYLSQIFSSAANQYYDQSSTKTDSGMSTFLNTFSTLFPKGV